MNDNCLIFKLHYYQELLASISRCEYLDDSTRQYLFNYFMMRFSLLLDHFEVLNYTSMFNDQCFNDLHPDDQTWMLEVFSPKCLFSSIF